MSINAPAFCSQCRTYQPRAGGMDKVSVNGRNHRWICAGCVERLKQRKESPGMGVQRELCK